MRTQNEAGWLDVPEMSLIGDRDSLWNMLPPRSRSRPEGSLEGELWPVILRSRRLIVSNCRDFEFRAHLGLLWGAGIVSGGSWSSLKLL